MRERERETNHDIILIYVVGIWLSVAQRVLEIIAQRLRVALDRNCYLFACQSSGRLDLLRTRSLCCNKIIVLFIIVRAIATLFRRCSQLHVNLLKKNQNRNEIQAFRDQPQMSGKWLWCDGRRWTYQIRVGGEFVADAQRTAARSHARRDGPVSCVTPTRTAAVAQKEARDAQSDGQLCRKRSSQLVTAALYSDGLLQRPRHTTCTPTIKDPRKMIKKCFNNNCFKSLIPRGLGVRICGWWTLLGRCSKLRTPISIDGELWLALATSCGEYGAAAADCLLLFPSTDGQKKHVVRNESTCSLNSSRHFGKERKKEGRIAFHLAVSSLLYLFFFKGRRRGGGQESLH